MKTFIRYIYTPEFNQREKLRDRLNALGFYVLNASEGIDVYVVQDRKSYIDMLIEYLF